MNDYPKVRLFVEALYEPETQKTFVRNPDNKNNWVESAIVAEVLTNTPVPSVSGLEECEIRPLITRAVSRNEGETQPVQLWITLAGRRHLRSVVRTDSSGS
jgi:hypothetical protein